MEIELTTSGQQEMMLTRVESSHSPLITSLPKMSTVMRLFVVSIGFLTDAYDLFVIGIREILNSQFVLSTQS
jgi:hypothetical protein